MDIRSLSLSSLWIVFLYFLQPLSSQVSKDVLRIGVIDYDEGPASAAYEHVRDDPHSARFIVIPMSYADLEYDRIQELREAFITQQIHCFVGSHDRVISLVTEKLGIPYLVTSLYGGGGTNVSFSLIPNPAELVRPLAAIMRRYQWTMTGVIYEEALDTGVISALVEHSKADLKFYKVAMLADKDELRKIMVNMRERDISNFLLLISSKRSQQLLRQARKIGVIARPFSWLALNLASEDIASDALTDLATNLTLVNFVKTGVGMAKKTNLNLVSCLMADAMSAAMAAYASKGTEDLARAIAKVQLTDDSLLTGGLQFKEGKRMNFSLDIFNFNGTEFLDIGEWRSHPNTLFEEKLDLKKFVVEQSGPDHFHREVTVVTILEKPFAMFKENYKELEGNDRFYGFAVDMMDKISAELGFTYYLYVVPDGNFGVEQPTGDWNGMIGEVLSGNATMSMAPLSINAARERVVDFTKPFKTRGITILMKTPESQSSYFQFMSPLDSKVWICIFIAAVTVAVVLFAFEHWSTACRTDFPKLNAQESAWFILGSLISGSTESTPVTVAGRILTSAWWFFALILISTYTANLAAFLTVKRIYPPITSVTDLADQSKIKYGTVWNSGVMSFFKNSQVEPFRSMWVAMSELNPDSMVNSTEEGLKKVAEGNYAFLWDNTVTSYMAAVDCDYTEIGQPFDPKGFGIAVPPGATYLDELSLVILRLADSGIINSLEHRWWGESECPDFSEPMTSETTELQLENVAGIFFVLLAGVALAVVACCTDVILRRLFGKSKDREAPTSVETSTNGKNSKAMSFFSFK